MRRITCILLMMIVAFSAFAADFNERLEQGNELLRKGDAAGAMSIFQGLQAEEPNAPDLLFSLGCAQYQLAEKDPKEAAKNLEGARESFEKAETLSSGRLTVDAGYNRANALAQIAKQPQGEESDPKAMQEAYQRSIQAYEQFLNRQPGHAKAQHNLDHMRFMLKQMEQNPPPPEQSQSDSDEEKEDEGDQQQQQQQQGGQGEQEDQQRNQDGENQQNNPEEQQKQDEQSKKDEQQQQQPSSQDPTQQPPQGQGKATAGEEKKDDQTVKSLLQSLENVDQEEQKRLREAPHAQGIQEEWW